LILVDIGSDSIEHLQVAREWADRDERIRVFRIDGREGIGGAKNHGIARSAGRYVCLIDPTDVIHPSALGIFARRLNVAHETNFLFSNEARIDATSQHISGYLSKPLFDTFTLLRTNYLGHLTAIRRDLMLSARRGEAVFRPGFEGIEDHDLFLRIALAGVNSIHVPLCLYYARTIPDGTVGRSEKAIELAELHTALLSEIVPQVYPGAQWRVRPPSREAGNRCPSIHITALSGKERPSLLVIVPFKDNLPLTLSCIQSLEDQQHDLNVQVILINNRSVGLVPGCELVKWLDQPRRNCYRVVDYDAAFNYARLHNTVIAQYGSAKDLVLFLNNDAELVTPDCLQTMAMQLLADERCGFVGIRLDYPDGQGVQHGGVQPHEYATTHGYSQIIHAVEPRQFISDERISFGVTFACAMTRRTVFEHLGGLEEVLLPNAYGDVDINARALEMGYRNYYFGTLLGTHHETKTRGRLCEDSDHVALHERNGQTISFWRPRSFSRSEGTWPPLIEPVPAPVLVVPEPQPEPSTIAVAVAATPHPLRYKVADRLNHAVKLALGPAHGALKKSILLSRSASRTRRDTSRSR
jgi:GT2 family glycosyltransferase